jgi:hypothetical protein
MKSQHCFLWAAVLLSMSIVSSLRGEVFMLAGGGQIAGEWLNRDEKPRQNYVIRAEGGGRITLSSTQVTQVLPHRPEREYETIRPRYPDTVEGQWALAVWCKENHLSAQRETHLRRILELDPDHAEARRLLGYSKINGHWTSRNDLGYKLYKGRWMLPQEIELLEAKNKQESLQQEWFLKIRRWRDWLGTPRDDQARQALAEIDDPMAAKALAVGLLNEGSVDVRLLYVEALAKIDTPEAVGTLAAHAIDDSEREVRLTCLDHLQTKPHPEVVRYFIMRLKKKNISNEIVNRIGGVLGRLKDPLATLPLIDALVTSHKFLVARGGPGSVSAAFGSGGTGLSMGGGPKYITRQIPNQSVLDALVAITGQNFSFDQHAWRAWLATQKKADDVNPRRD